MEGARECVISNMELCGSINTHTATWRWQQKTLKHPAKYCNWSRLHMQQRPFKHYLSSYSIHLLLLCLIPYCLQAHSWTPKLHMTANVMRVQLFQNECGCFSLLSLSVSLAVIVPRMVSLQGTRPQAGRTKCQLSLNAVTFLTQKSLSCLVFINKIERTSRPNKQLLVFMRSAKIVKGNRLREKS